jgi:hypothetical protein
LLRGALRVPRRGVQALVPEHGFRQELFVHRSCVPLDMIDFAALAPNTLDPMTTGECKGMCGL